MNSPRDPVVNAALLQRIDALRADTAPRWGRMTVSQMLAHCQKAFLVASGELKLKRGLVGRLFGKLAKKKYVLSDVPFKRNLPTDPHFLITVVADFEREQAGLGELVKRYGESGAAPSAPHPFFGAMSAEEWDRLRWKHLDHHLRQFGV